VYPPSARSCPFYFVQAVLGRPLSWERPGSWDHWGVTARVIWLDLLARRGRGGPRRVRRRTRPERLPRCRAPRACGGCLGHAGRERFGVRPPNGARVAARVTLTGRAVHWPCRCPASRASMPRASGVGSRAAVSDARELLPPRRRSSPTAREPAGRTGARAGGIRSFPTATSAWGRKRRWTPGSGRACDAGVPARLRAKAALRLRHGPTPRTVYQRLPTPPRCVGQSPTSTSACRSARGRGGKRRELRTERVLGGTGVPPDPPPRGAEAERPAALFSRAAP